MSDSVTKRLIAVQNEQRAQKIAAPLNYGQLVIPSPPSKTWSGYVSDGINPTYGVVARWVATFTRSDEVLLPPFVIFPYDFTLAQYFYEFLVSSGTLTSVSGRDRRSYDEFLFSDALLEIGSNYVSWKIEIDRNFYYNGTGTTVTINVQALSTVPGTLTLTRVI